MPKIKPIRQEDDFALVKIILDYIQGHSIDEITLRLKERCNEFDFACKDRYQAIGPRSAGNQYHPWLDSILDALSVGGTQLHLMSVHEAKAAGWFNCYVWDQKQEQLVYLQSGCDAVTIELQNNELLTRTIRALASHRESRTLHLFARQIAEAITFNSVSGHVPHTTDLELIERYKSSANLYDVLKKLKLKHPRLSILLDKIDGATPASRWWFYLSFVTGFTAIAGIVYYLKENFTLVRNWYERAVPIVSHWLNNTVNLLRKTPLIGILTNGIPLVNAWYQAILDGSITDTNKLITLSFKSIEHTLPIIAFVLCYLAAGTMTLSAVTLFITAAVIDVIESLYTLIYQQVVHYFHPLSPATDYYSAVKKADADSARERNLFVSLVTITANLLATASVVIWCFFPPNFIISIACVVLSTLVGLTKGTLVDYIKMSEANAFQSELKDIKHQYNPSNHTARAIENLQLHEQLRELEQKNLLLKTERDTIKAIREQDREQDRTRRRMTFFSNSPSSIAANSDLNDGLEGDNSSDIEYNRGQ